MPVPSQVPGTINLVDPANTFGATVWAAGELRVQEQPTQQFFSAFDTGLDTTNIWKAPTAAGGGVAATNTVASTVLGTGTTANGYSYLESQVTFPPESPGWLLVQLAVNLEFAVSLNAYRFWGLGTSPGSPTSAAPLTNAVGIEVATTGKMYAVVYASGTRFAIQDLSVATGNGKQPQDANVHSHNIYFRGDKIYWSIDSLDNIVAQTYGGPGPDVNQLPVKATAIAHSTPPGGSVLLTVNAATVAATSRNNMQISDGTYQWRKAAIDALGNLAIKRDVSATGTLSNIASSATVVTLLALNVARKGVMIFNDSTAQLYVAFAAAASLTNFSIKVAPGGTYVMDPYPIYAGIITGIWDGANGNARMSEFT
jgi:hypothetical protein